MEKTNELNKFLSYIHMGNSVFRIYYNEAKNLNDQNLIDLIVEIEEIFKTHEEKITSLIKDMGEEATNSLTAAGLMGLYKEKLKMFDDSFDIMLAAIKSTNMGLLSSMKFLHQNKDLPDDVKKHVINVVKDYSNIITKLTNHSLRKML
jgi:uncharacterized protein YyaL (SSP411 family)